MRQSARSFSRPRARQLKQLRRSCEALLTELDLPPRITIPMLVDQLGRRRGRPILLTPMELREGSVYGLWIATDAADVIAYESRTTLPHQHHLIAHELAHIMCGHRGAGEDGSDAGLLRLFPALDPRMVRALLRRSGYSDREEQEAETMASLLRIGSTRQSLEPVWQAPPEEVGTLSRIERSLGHPGSGPGTV